jgi:DNA-binding MarR family transcriptional regulator
LVRRSPDAVDHRARCHHLTPSGTEALGRVRTERHRWLAGVVADLDPGEREALTELLDRLADGFRLAIGP